MDVKTIAMIALTLSIIAIIISVVAFSGSAANDVATLGISSARQCSDKKDNDGDGKIDMNDAGCSNRNDNDESNCGDRVCEGGETCSSCATDCGSCPTTSILTTNPTTSIITTTIPNSCSDTDGGMIYTVKGTISGYYNSQPYSNTDYCSGSTGVLVEYYCSAGSSFNTAYNCVGNSTTSCVDGACI
jgi:hypothetical protein